MSPSIITQTPRPAAIQSDSAVAIPSASARRRAYSGAAWNAKASAASSRAGSRSNAS